MNKETIDDLKQFISTAISQQTSDLQEDIGEIKQDIKILDRKIVDLSDSVAGAMSDTNEDVDEQLKNHEHRITKLEHKPA